MKKTILALLLSVLMITSVFALDYTIELVDSYGDGWNGGSVTVNVDGSPVLENLTIEDGNGPESHTFAIEPGHELSTVYTAGSWSTENEYQIKNELGIVVAESGQGGVTPGNVSYTVPQAGSPSIPVLTSPANGAVNVAIDATLEWTTGDNTDHAVLYIADNAELTDAIMVDPATSPYSPTLALNTTYYWKVVAVSATALETETAVWSFTSEYGTASVPYLENFDNSEDGEQAPGWISLDNTGNSYTYAEVDNSNALSGENSYKIYNSSVSTGDIIGSTPKVENAGNRVRFSAKGSTAGTILYVGTMTDATDEATFTRLDSLSLTTTYTQYIVDLPGDRAEDHVSFKHGFGGTYRSIYLDDVNIEEVPTEAIINLIPETVDFGGLMYQDTTATPTTVTISNVGGVSAEITETSILNTSYFQLIDENTYPVTLEPQASISVAVKPLTTLIGTHTSSLRFKQTDPGNPFVPINHDVALTVEVLDSTGDDHNNPFVLTLANEIIEEHTTAPYNNTYDFCSSPSVVYQLTLPQAKILDISLEGTTWDTKLWVFNSFEQIDNATQNTDAWYYNDDESSAGTGGSRFNDGEKARDRAVWSKMNPSFALAGDYYIVVSGYNTNSGEFIMTINSESIPAPTDGATNPFPADDAVDQPSTLTLTWDNVDYTETIDIYFGEAGSMVMVENDIPVVDEYQVTGLLTLTEYEWKIVNRNYMGETPADSVETWSFNTVGTAPEATTYTAPADQATDQALNGNLTWNAATGADGYYVYFSTDETFAGVTPVDQAETTYAYSGDYDTTYYWKVVPYNVVGQPTEGIVVWSFTTGLSPFPDADLVFDGVRSVNHGMPMEPYYGYTMTQNIYLQEELDIDDSAISSISYLYNNNSAWSETIEVYMKHTTKDSFADTYDWELDGFTHVYSGTMTVDTTNPIVTIDLATPFVYNNTDNLLVLFFATESGFHSSSDEFYNYSLADNKSLTVRSDGTNYVTTFPTSVPSGTLKAFRPVSGFTYEEVSADPVFTVSADTLTFTDQIMGTDSDSQTLTISNLGLGTLGITNIEIVGTNADQFILTDNNTYPASLEITENISVGVVYSPNNEGDHTAQLEITDDQARVVNVVELVGNSVDTNIYATDLPWNESFEGSLLGWSTIIETTSPDYAGITLNTSTTNVQDGSTAIQFYNSGDLTANLQLIAPNLVPDMDGYRLRFWTKGTIDSEIILAKWDSDMTILTAIDTFAVPLTYEQTTIEFEGTTTGNERFAFIPVFATTYDYVYLDNITFEATPLVPVAELSTNAIDFGEIEVATTSVAEEVTITNVGPGTLNISNVGITGTDAGLFAWEYVEETPDMALENGESLAITVTFTPDALGLKEATLAITDDLARNVRVSYSSKAANTSRAVNEVALTGTGWLPPQGSTCSDPLPLTFPAVDVTGNTVDFLDDYSSTWISPSSSYLNGDDVVYQFTLANTMLLNGTITTTGSWMGAFILENEPNVDTPAEVLLTKSSSGNTLTYTNEMIPAGTYFLIISSYPSPQSVDYTINLTADALPIPEAATNPSPANQAIDQATALTLEWTNADYTETIDLYFGTTGAREMALVLDDVAAVEEYAVTDLDANTEYSWKVVCRNYTGETIADSVVTWTFTTVGSAPEAVTYTAPVDTATDVALSGNLTWQAGTGANGYYVYFSTDETFAGVTPEDQAGTSYAFSGLDYETTYYWKVIPYNVVGQATEGIVVWSFTTIPDPTMPMPVTIDFEGTTANPAAITSENFSIGTNVHNTVGNVMYKNIYSSSSNGYIQFQAMNGITATSVISLDYRMTNWSAGTVGITSVEGHEYLNIYASTDNGATFDPVDAVNGTDHVDSAEFATFTADISAYAGQSVIFRFEMTDDEVNDYWFDIDNIYFGEPAVTDPDVPVNFAIANDGASITLTWDAAANANSYNIYGCDTPDGEFVFIEAVDGLTHTFTATDMMKFYSVKASTDTISPAKRFGRRN